MLSYRHAFHAGNHADALKHLALTYCLSYMNGKDTPYLYVDTHAGAGAYDLGSGYADRNREWEGGYALLSSGTAGMEPAGAGETPRAERLPAALAAYLAAVEAFRRAEALPNAYPGSPALAAAIMRKADRAALFELHPADHALLAERFAADRRVRVLKENGFSSLKALLPPPSRRALVLMDPSYELGGDYASVRAALAEALKRFAGCVVLIWYPVLDRAEARELPAMLREEAARAGRPWLDEIGRASCREIA